MTDVGDGLDYVYVHKVHFIRNVLKKQPKHAFMKLDGEGGVFEQVNKIIDEKLPDYSRLKREDERLLTAIKNDEQIQCKGANATELRFKNPLFHIGVFVETADDVVKALEKISPLDDHHTLRLCTNIELEKNESFKPVDDAIYQCRAYGIFASREGTNERYMALFHRDQESRCHVPLSGKVRVEHGQMKVETTDDLRPELRSMDAVTIQGRTYRVNGSIVSVHASTKAVTAVRVEHEITRENGLSSTSNAKRLIHGSDKGLRRKYPIEATCFYLDRPFEGKSADAETAYREGAPNDVRDLWAQTLGPAAQKLESVQNDAERMANDNAPPKKRVRRARKK